MRLYPALVQLGYQVPNQLGLATFDQPDWSGLVQPSLTCVGQPVDTMGALTGEMLLQRLGKPDETVSFEVKTIASNLVFGGSTRLHG
nr:substrate-binding domain-containing protein [Alicyclobacillus fastidiosus]